MQIKCTIHSEERIENLRSFSVAIWYHVAKNEITRAQLFRSVKQLEEFVDDINVSKLYDR